MPRPNGRLTLEERRAILERDHYLCAVCKNGGKGSDWILEVDHINGEAHDHRPENLQTLCVRCHNNKHPLTIGEQEATEPINFNLCQSMLSQGIALSVPCMRPSTPYANTQRLVCFSLSYSFLKPFQLYLSLYINLLHLPYLTPPIF